VPLPLSRSVLRLGEATKANHVLQLSRDIYHFIDPFYLLFFLAKKITFFCLNQVNNDKSSPELPFEPI
jgi:hypothetical protein